MLDGLAVLGIENWADFLTSKYNWISRQKLIDLANGMKNHGFSARLQALLHDPIWGKHSFHCLDINSKTIYKTSQDHSICPLQKCKYGDSSTVDEGFEPKILSWCAKLAVSPHGNDLVTYTVEEIWSYKISYNNGIDWESYRVGMTSYNEQEFPAADEVMPENIKTFKQVSIRFIDDQVLNFLIKIKPLFTDVYLIINSYEHGNLRIFLDRLLPMINSIRGIRCSYADMKLIEHRFPPRILESVPELVMTNDIKRYHISTYWNWLTTPLGFAHQQTPRFLILSSLTQIGNEIPEIINAVHKRFLKASIGSTFAIYILHTHAAKELIIENMNTKEELSIRNASTVPIPAIPYVEVLRYPKGADTDLREWLEKRAFYEEIYNNDEPNREILIHHPTYNMTEQDNSSAKVQDNFDSDGPSANAK